MRGDALLQEHPRDGRVLVWRRDGSFGAEYARVACEGSRLVASGIQIGTVPFTHVMHYHLVTGDDYVTRRLDVGTEGSGWRRSITLARDDGGRWTYRTETLGDVDLPAMGCATDTLVGALDCDLAGSPLTNTMPVLRDGLLRAGGPMEFVMAWVSVPDLRVFRSQQAYSYVGRGRTGSIVRYESRDGRFARELEFDEHGFVVSYPGLARRIS